MRTEKEIREEIKFCEEMLQDDSITVKHSRDLNTHILALKWVLKDTDKIRS